MNENVAQTLRINDLLINDGFDSRVHLDQLGVPTVVSIRDVFKAEQVAEIVRNAFAVPGTTNGPDKRLGSVPYGCRSRMVYPASVCVLLDSIVRAAANDENKLAWRTYAPEAGRAHGVGDAGAHTDYPANLDDPGAGELHGLNIHLTLEGSATAQFSLVSDFKEVTETAAAINDFATTGTPTPIEVDDFIIDRFQDTMRTATAPIEHSVGDVLVFQARSHRSRDLLPTAHQFLSATNNRWYNVFVPKALDRTEVFGQRLQLLDDELKDRDDYRNLEGTWC